MAIICDAWDRLSFITLLILILLCLIGIILFGFGAVHEMDINFFFCFCCCCGVCLLFFNSYRVMWYSIATTAHTYITNSNRNCSNFVACAVQYNSVHKTHTDTLPLWGITMTNEAISTSFHKRIYPE